MAQIYGGAGVEGASEPGVSIFSTEGAGPGSGLRTETNEIESRAVSKEKPQRKSCFHNEWRLDHLKVA